MNPLNVFLINLEERQDRFSDCLVEFEKVDLTNWSKFKAIKYDPEIHGYVKQFTKFCSLPKLQMTKTYLCGSFGCMLSHYNIIKYAKQEKMSSILILEDDFHWKQIQTGENWLEKSGIQKCLNELREWSMFYLSANHVTIPIQFSNNTVRPTRGYTTTGYILKYEMYDLILDNMLEYGKEIDVFYAEVLQKRNDVFCSTIPLIMQRPSYSNILGQYTDYIYGN